VNDSIQIAAILVAGMLLAAVLRLVVRGRLREEYAFAWLVGSGLLLAIAIWRRSLDIAASWLGVFYPPAVLLLAVVLAVFCIGLYFSVVISKQRQQIERLVEEVALLDAEIRERAPSAAPSGSITGPEMVEASAHERDGAA